MGNEMSQRDIQVWNDAVQACERAAMEAVIQIELAKGDGMPDPARSVVRAVGHLFSGRDTRTIITGIDASQFPR